MGSLFGRRKATNRKTRFRNRVILFLAVVVLTVWVVDMKLRPTVQTMAEHEARVLAVKSINQAVSAELAQQNIRYDDLVLVHRSEQGEVTSIETDMLGLNSLKTNIASRVTENLEAVQEEDLGIPLGTLLGNQFFAGRGPSLGFKMIPAGLAQTNFENKFEQAGINQTRHQIMMRIAVEVTIFMPGYTSHLEITTNFCVAETVIVGAVPEAFTEVTGDDDSIQRKIFDYGTVK